MPRATTSEETPSGPDQYAGDKRDGAIAVEDVPAVEKNAYNEIVPAEMPKEESPVAVDGQTSELLEKLNIKVCINLYIVRFMLVRSHIMCIYVYNQGFDVYFSCNCK